MRSALYIRVSTEEQANEGYSIGSQRDRLTAYVHSQDWEIYDYYIDDGYSAKDTNRPKLQRMISDAKEKKFDVVLVHKLDRFSRSVKDLYVLIDEFEKVRVGFRSAQEQFDTTTPMGKAMMGMLGIFAQWERETIAERVFWGQEQMVHEGRRPGAIAPLGYKLENGKLVIDPVGAAFVRRLFSMYTYRNGMPKITKLLHQEGIQIHIKTLSYILTNPTYIGKIRWNHRKDGMKTNKDIISDGDHEPIISAEEFERVQSLIVTRTSKGKAATSNFPFSTVAKCGRCGSSFAGSSRMRENGKGRERFYRCTGKINYGSCDMPNIAEHKFEKEFLEKLHLDKRSLARLITLPVKPKEHSKIDELEKELASISSRRKRWQLAFGNGLIEIEELRQHLEPDKKREAEIRELLHQSSGISRPQYTKDDFLHQLIQIRELWPQVDDFDAKKDLVEDLFESITFNTDAKPGKQKFNVEITGWKLK